MKGCYNVPDKEEPPKLGEATAKERSEYKLLDEAPRNENGNVVVCEPCSDHESSTTKSLVCAMTLFGSH